MSSLSSFHPIPMALYVGIAVVRKGKSSSQARFGVYIHDGFWSYDFYRETSTKDDNDVVNDTIIEFLREYQTSKQCKIVMAGLVNGTEEPLKELGRRLWFELDILPCILRASGYSLDEKACSAARKTNQYISPTGVPGVCRIEVGYRHEVEVDANGHLSFCNMDNYKRYFKDATWDILMKTSALVRERKKRIVFFNSTPQGGGVAIIRHSTIRIFKLLGIDAHWFVMKPNPEVFEITKKKFHNVLQGVSPDDIDLTEHDMAIYEQWCNSNVSTYWSGEDSPICKADVIVIDDPQPSGMIPVLKKINPNATLVYRSHIEIRSDLTRKKGTIQEKVWGYLWKNIKLCDVFVSHPVPAFIPDEVVESNLVVKMIPAVTDPCDGLNKHLDPASLRYYQLLFNRTAYDQLERRVDFSRPYFLQVSRFDPSKGIPDLIEAYVRFRKMLAQDEAISEANMEYFDNSRIPQLVITGHGSIDDPEGTVIYRQIINILDKLSNESWPWIYENVVKDIIVVRLGPSDQMLNAVLSSAMCAFQLSHREGFEVKVSEALLKGVPVIAYASGGIPLQIRDGIDGHLIPTGDIDAVVRIMYKVLKDVNHYRQLRERAATDNHEWILTPSNVIHWNKIMLMNEHDTI